MHAIGLIAAIVTNLCGTVTFEREGLPFFFMDASDGVHWRVERAPRLSVSVGDRVIVSGKREPSVKHRLAETTVRHTGTAAVPPHRSIDIADLFAKLLPYGNTELYGGLFETEGLLRDINRRQTTTQLLVGEGDCNLQVEIPWSLEEALPAQLVQGAYVRVRGVLTYTSIENYEEGIFGRIENIELIPAAPNAVTVVKRAPYWTAARLTKTLIALSVLLALLATWLVTLRRAIRRKTNELRESVRQQERVRIEATAAQRERLRLAADLHDGFQQYLAGAMFRLKAAQNYLPAEAVESRAQLDKVKDALQHTQNGLRATLWAMNEVSEGPESVLQLFEYVARRLPHWEDLVTISSTGTERKIAHNYAGSLLLILQEAVGNAITHGKATEVKVQVDFEERSFALTVTDNGHGFDVEQVRREGHYGLGTMERRTAELGGKMQVTSAVGAGATLAFRFPM